MSKFNKCGLALAIAGAMALPMSAMAATAGYAEGQSPTYASNLFGTQGQVVTIARQYSIATEARDNIIGRTTGFGIRLTLGNGAQFATGTAAAPLTPLTVAEGGAATGYEAEVAQVSGNVAVISMGYEGGEDGAAAPISVGALLNITQMNLRNLGALADGGSVPVTIELFDSNTASVFQEIDGDVLLSTAQGVFVDFNARTAGDANKRIDVSPCGEEAAKSRFSPNGDVGASCTTSAEGWDYFNAGSITARTATVDGPTDYVLGLNGSSPFVIGASDTVSYVLGGANFAPFAGGEGEGRIFLSLNGSCSTADLVLTVNAAGTAATGTRVGPATAAGTPLFACFEVADEDRIAIDAQQITASVSVDFESASIRDASGFTGNLRPLRYNGTVLQFQNVNPASNAQAQSFMRFTNNNSSFNCPITLEGKDDRGVAGDSTVRFVLAPGASTTLNSEVLELGQSVRRPNDVPVTGAFGDGQGRWVVTANAECNNVVGSALNRNTDTGTVTNLTPEKRDAAPVLPATPET